MGKDKNKSDLTNKLWSWQNYNSSAHLDSRRSLNGFNKHKILIIIPLFLNSFESNKILVQTVTNIKSAILKIASYLEKYDDQLFVSKWKNHNQSRDRELLRSYIPFPMMIQSYPQKLVGGCHQREGLEHWQDPFLPTTGTPANKTLKKSLTKKTTTTACFIQVTPFQEKIQTQDEETLKTAKYKILAYWKWWSYLKSSDGDNRFWTHLYGNWKEEGHGQSKRIVKTNRHKYYLRRQFISTQNVREKCEIDDQLSRKEKRHNRSNTSIRRLQDSTYFFPT